MVERGYEAEPVGFEEAGPVLRCRPCGFRQVVNDGISAAEVETVVGTIQDDDERLDALEAHDVRFCVIERCPRCGRTIDAG